MKIYLIGLYEQRSDASDVQSIIKATTSLQAAIDYCNRQADIIKQMENVVVDDRYWIEGEKTLYVDYHYNVGADDVLHGKKREWNIRIEETDLICEDVPESMRPALEERCEALEKQVDSLKEENGNLKADIEKAASQLTFWDGGKYESFDHLRDSINTAKGILRK